MHITSLCFLLAGRMLYADRPLCGNGTRAILSHGTTVRGFRPNYQTTQCNELCIVTLYHTYPQRSKPSIFLVNRKPKKTGDSSHTNPPLACNTQQYAAQTTLIQNTNMHLGAITGPRSFQPPPHPSWTTPPCPWNPRWCGLACCR
jgi:hypothetical protein